MSINKFALDQGFINDGNYTISSLPSTTSKGLELSIAEPIIDGASVSMVKSYYKIKTDADDDAIERNIRTSLNTIENYTQKNIVERQVTARWKRVPRIVKLPRPPHGAITSVRTIDDDGTETVLTEGTDYYVIGNEVKWVDIGGTASTSLEVVYTAGYGKNLTDIPTWAQDAIIFQLGVFYSNFDESMGTRVYDNGLKIDERAVSACKGNVYYGDV